VHVVMLEIFTLIPYIVGICTLSMMVIYLNTDYNTIFSKDETDVGHITLLKHSIYLHDEHPCKQRYRRIPPSMYEEVRNHLQLLLRIGIIRKSHSPYSSNLVLVKKKDNSLRICVIFQVTISSCVL
jgi:hypothetical protein